MTFGLLLAIGRASNRRGQSSTSGRPFSPPFPKSYRCYCCSCISLFAAWPANSIDYAPSSVYRGRHHARPASAEAVAGARRSRQTLRQAAVWARIAVNPLTPNARPFAALAALPVAL